MPRRDIWHELEALRRRAFNLSPRELEAAARRAGWFLHHIEGGHAIYVKEGYPFNLSIPLHKLKGKTALRVIKAIEASLMEGKEEQEDGKERGDGTS